MGEILVRLPCWVKCDSDLWHMVIFELVVTYGDFKGNIIVHRCLGSLSLQVWGCACAEDWAHAVRAPCLARCVQFSL